MTLNFSIAILLDVLHDVIVLAVGLLQELVDALELTEGHIRPHLLEISGQVGCSLDLFTFFIQLTLLDWVNLIKYLSISDALNRRCTVQLDVPTAVVLDRVLALELAHLNKDEGDAAALVLEANVHVLGVEALSNRPLNLFISFHQAFDLNLLFNHLVQHLHFVFYSFAAIRDLVAYNLVVLLQLAPLALVVMRPGVLVVVLVPVALLRVVAGDNVT